MSSIKTTRSIKKKHAMAIFGALFAVLTLIPFGAIPQASFATGNGAPSGPHFNLNLIGVQSSNFSTTDQSGGNVIFVPLFGNCKILLAEGTDFAVLDNNCMDKQAQFQLPPPQNVTTGAQLYTVWARVLGTPGGSSSLVTCATLLNGTTECNTGNTVSFGSHNGKSKFTNVTTQLTTVVLLNGTTLNIFSPGFSQFFWNYTDTGNKLVQLRFYPT
jgi:hypothetical protein